MSRQKRTLILGIGQAQVDLAAVSRSLGYEILACSNTDAGAARELVDIFEVIDIADADRVEVFAREQGADLVYSVGSDIAMPTACLVSERLGLPHLVSSRTARICNSKPDLRAHLGPEFVGNLEYQTVQHWEEIRASRYPLVMKPSDSQGQRGVCRVESLEEARRSFDATRAFARDGRVILERFVDGPEVSVNTYSVDGEMVFAVISDRISWPDLPGGIIHEHLVPSVAASGIAGEAILDLVQRTLKALPIDNGPAYFQLKLQDDEPFLIEATPRLDGCHMWRLLKYYTSVDLLETTMRHLAGSPPDSEAMRQGSPRGALRLEFLCDEPGRPMQRQQFAVPDPLFLHWYYQDGDRIRPMNGRFEKCGYHISNL